MKSSKEQQQLLDMVERRRGLKDERLRMIKLKAEHKQTLEGIGGEDISDAKVQKRAQEAQLGITLCDARLARLNVPDSEFEAIERLKKVVGTRWNEEVVRARDAALEELIWSQLPFFNDERECRKYWKNAFNEHPMFYKFRKAFYDFPSGPREERDIIREVESLISAMERHSKALGLS